MNELTPSKYGLVFDEQHAAAMAAESKTPIFSLAAPRLMDAKPREVFFLRHLVMACREEYGNDFRLNSQFQKRGTCGGQGSKTVVDMSLAVARYLFGRKFAGRSAVCGNYAGSRVEIGNYRVNGDGTAGSWVATWLVRYGALLLETLGLDPNYYVANGMDEDEQLSIDWAEQPNGVPQQFEKVAAERPFEKAILIQTVDELVAAQSAYNVVFLASDWIPEKRRDARGVSRCVRDGGHLTACAGQFRRSGEWFFPYVQSWGNNWFQGPWNFSNPIDKDLGSFCTLVDESDMQRMLSQRQSYALVRPEGLDPVGKDFAL